MSVPAPNRNYSTESVLIAVFSMTALLVHLLTNGRHGYFRDELYYIACGRHLAFGYVDQPPLSILLLRLSQLLLGDSLFAIRFLPALAGAAIVALTGMIAREIGGRAWAIALACAGSGCHRRFPGIRIISCAARAIGLAKSFWCSTRMTTTSASYLAR